MAMEIPGYQIIRELGKGGMATVYLAIQESFGREVALKIMSSSLSADPDFHERFLREAQIVSRLVHPNIVTVYDIGERDGHHYMSMEYVKGKDLRHKRDQLSLLERLRIIKEVALALDYASKKGYIHRDVKPDNIMLREEDGRAVLMDFGIARAVEVDVSMTQTGTVIGTPQYMSPEQARGTRVDHRADLYSLGVVMFQLLAGRVPYHAETPVAVALKHITDPLPQLPNKLRVFQPVIDKVLAKDPDHRYQSGAEMVVALDRISAACERALLARKGQNGVEDENGAGDTPARTPTLAMQPKVTIKTNRQDSAPTAPQDAVRVPADYRRTQSSTRSGGGAGLWLWLLLIVTGGAGAAYYLGYLDPWLGRWQNPFETAQAPGRDAKSPPVSAGESAEPPAAPVTSAPTVSETSPPPATDTAETTDAAPESTVSNTPQETSAADPAATLVSKIETQAQELELRVASDLSVAPQLAQLYLLVLSDQPDQPWATKGLAALQERHLEAARAAFASGDTGKTRQYLEWATASYPDTRRLAGFVSLGEQLNKSQRVSELLQQAEQHLANNALTSPAGANALESFQAALTEDVGNTAARLGITRIAERYAALAEAHLDKGELEKAMAMVKRGLSVDPDQIKLKELGSQITSLHTRLQQVHDLLNQARTLQTAGKLIQPGGANAFDSYRRVLKLDAGNREANQGLRAIEAELAQRIRTAMSTGQLDDAALLLAEARERFAQSSTLLELQSRLDEVRESAVRAAAEAIRPKVTRLRVSGSALQGLEGPQPSSFRADRTLHIGFDYQNLQQETTVIQAILYDGARSMEIAQVGVVVTGANGIKFFQIARPVEGFPEGGYNLDLVLEGERLSSDAFSVEK